ncbi:hypothetical protein CERSUDRAFT_154363 [Gelatoporia subvermispora B]|uniref:Uncharacterized protein n=1 Tax=Ceriporiopsis subvermispora (strain B) TaxID=914234 RepID=M2RFM7_CERS8|nr:hypothetical protein CERSUDRAFT_154363 [Gelatoporia subvermispora B]
MLYLSYLNDIMSFYKEEVAGDQGTYVLDRACTTGKMHVEALYEVVDDTVDIVKRVRRIPREGPARDAWDTFVTAYIAFHTNTPKYRLQEIMDVYYLIQDDV